MSNNIFIVTESENLSMAVRQYLEGTLGPKPECTAWTYGKEGIPGDRFRAADLLILGLFGRDDLGYRVEGLGTAEKMASSRRRILLISGCTLADQIACPYYWDLAAPDSLCERIQMLLKAAPPSSSDYIGLKDHFQSYIRPAVDRHRLVKSRS